MTDAKLPSNHEETINEDDWEDVTDSEEETAPRKRLYKVPKSFRKYIRNQVKKHRLLRESLLSTAGGK